jgi:hypothetical protein
MIERLRTLGSRLLGWLWRKAGIPPLQEGDEDQR